MGMGGSSLAPDILHRTFGTIEGYLDLRILDSTDPAYVSATLDDLDPLRTLMIIASKSGTTTEPNAFHAAMAEVAPAFR
jgi:transaldolase/glucose-6-phosphate isomerase